MKKIKRGLLLNLEYEGSYIAWKLLLFCVLFYVIQICVGYALVSEKAKVIYAIDGYGTVGFLRYNELFNHSIMPYIFTVFIVASFFGVYYIFKKDKTNSNKLNAIYTLPFPRYCNFFAKLFYCFLCPISVYAVQILANITIIQFHFNEISFRQNELFLSSQFSGVYQILFAPSSKMLVIILLLLTFVTSFFKNYTLNSVASGFKGPSIYSFLQTIALVTSVNLMFNTRYIQNFWICFYAITVCVVCIILDIYTAYRKVRI